VLPISGHPDVAVYARTVGADAWFRKGDPLATLLALVERLLKERS